MTSRTANELTYGDLEQLLHQWGFQREQTAPAVFRHRERDALVALPAFDPHEPVAAFHLASIRKLVIERGIVPEDAFNRETRAVRTS